MTTKARKVHLGLDAADGDMYLGIDQSYSGFAMTALWDSGAFRTEVHRLPLTGTARLVEAQRLVNNYVDTYGPAKGIGMEGYAPGSKFGREIAGELAAAVRLGLWANGHREVQVFAPTVVKKFATGRGNAKKNEVLLSVYKKWEVEFDDDNAADSYVIAHLTRGGNK